MNAKTIGPPTNADKNSQEFSVLSAFVGG